MLRLACYDAINNFGKLRIKENLAEKLKQIGQIEVTPDCTKICREFFRKVKAGFHMIADDRGSQIAENSAIVCDHMETHFCDRLRSCDRDRRRSQKIEPCSIFCDRLRSFAILRSYGNQSSAICDRNVSHNIFNSDR